MHKGGSRVVRRNMFGKKMHNPLRKKFAQNHICKLCMPISILHDELIYYPQGVDFMYHPIIILRISRKVAPYYHIQLHTFS